MEDVGDARRGRGDRFVRGRLVNGKVVLENLAPHDAKLINDHLEWSEEHRCWACKHCNERSIAAADLVDDDEYRQQCRRTRTNNRTFAAAY